MNTLIKAGQVFELEQGEHEELDSVLILSKTDFDLQAVIEQTFSNLGFSSTALIIKYLEKNNIAEVIQSDKRFFLSTSGTFKDLSEFEEYEDEEVEQEITLDIGDEVQLKRKTSSSEEFTEGKIYTATKTNNHMFLPEFGLFNNDGEYSRINLKQYCKSGEWEIV